MPRHAEIRRMPWSADQMFGLIADIAAYPEFLPWCQAARIRRRTALPEGAELVEADLVIRFKVFRERFGSRVMLHPEARRIDVAYLDGPFRYLDNKWHFRPLPDGGCEVDFSVDFEFRNAVLQKVVGLMFHEAMQRIVRAFEARAEDLHGRPPA